MSISPPSYHCFNIKCSWKDSCINTKCLAWRSQRAGAWYMCQANEIAKRTCIKWGPAKLPNIKAGMDSGGFRIVCWDYKRGTTAENSQLDDELAEMKKLTED